MTKIIQNLGKLNLLIIAGASVTLLLFHLMQMLILTSAGPVQSTPGIKISSPVIPDLVIKVNPTTPKPDPIEPPVILPTLKNILPGAIESFFNQPIAPQPIISNGSDANNFSLLQSQVLALVQVQPQYPQRALARDIEGYVVVEFDVDQQGQVVNPRVLTSEPVGTFDRSALQAMARWKYSPKMVDGKAVMMYGMQQKLSYSIDE